MPIPANGIRKISSDTMVAIILFCFGVILSIIYWRHKIVPNSDFPAFLMTGNELLNFQIPSSFKRAPLLGLAQAVISLATGGSSPALTAGCLINAVVYPFIIVLFYLTAKRFLGRSAVYFALIAAINPDCLDMLTDPIVETSLLAVILTTFFFLFKQSPWAYFFAGMASMLRYEGALLIGLVFFWFNSSTKNTRDRLKSIGYAFLAAIPFLAWMAMTVFNWDQSDPTHYLKESGSQDYYVMFLRYMALTWKVGFSSLLTQIATLNGNPIASSHFLATIIGVFGLGSSLFWSIRHKRLDLLFLILFLVAYLSVHIWHGFIYNRFCATISWIPLLLCWYGLLENSIWLYQKIDKPILTQPIIPAILIAGFIGWTVLLIPAMTRYSLAFSTTSTFLPYIAATVAVAGFSLNLHSAKGSAYLMRDIAMVSLVLLMIVSNQFNVSTTLQNGKRDMEFKLLADWHRQHAEPDQKLATSMPHVVRLFSPSHKDVFISTGSIKGDDPIHYLANLKEQNIRYIAWDSRIGMARNDRFYTLWGMDKIAMLIQPNDNGPYKFLTQIRNGNRFINIFEVR